MDQKEKTTTGSDTFILSGLVEKGGRVIVNKISAEVQADGRFSIEVPLKEGRNTLTLVATDQAGNEATKEYTVIYNKPSSNSGGLVLPIAVVIIVAAAAVVVAVAMHKKGRKAA